MSILLNLEVGKSADKSNKNGANRDYVISNLKAGKLVSLTYFPAFGLFIADELFRSQKPISPVSKSP